jgi:hypothetical protein
LQVQASGLDAQAQDQWLNYLETVSADIKAAIDAIDTAKGPGKLTELAPVGGGGVSTAGVDSAAQGLINKERELLELKLQNLDIADKAGKAAAVNALSNVRIDSENTINNILKTQTDELNKQQRVAELQLEGLNEAQATAIQAVEAARALSLARLDGLEAAIKTKIADSGDLELVQALRKELEAVAIARGQIESKAKTGVDNATELNKGLTKTEQLATDISEQFSNGFADALVGAVQGTKDLGESFQELAADILAAIGKALILRAITTAIGGVGVGGNPGTGILGDLFRAEGGPVTGNQPYVVGEKGPELFIPGVTGTVTNNDQFEAARDAMSGGGGGSSAAFSENTDALAVSNSYTRERVLERESNERSTSSGTMLVETQVINNVEYVSKDQLEVATAASAKKARAQVFSDMRNRPATRRQLGLNS